MSVAIEAKTEEADETLVQESGLVRVRRCRHGLMAYITHDSYIGRSLDLYGEFSSGEAEVFSQMIKPGMWVLDVGANIGAHAVLFAQKAGPKGRVIAFEPQRVLYQLLCANLGMNGLFNVDLRNAAAGSTAGELHVPPVDYGREGNYGSLSLGQWTEGAKVPIEPIDSLNLPACHFIKADVEGMEAEVIRGARETIRKHRPVIYVENDREAKSKELNELIFSLDYRCFWHFTPYYSSKNLLGNPENVFEGVYSINMLCVPKESAIQINGLRELQSAEEDWITVGKGKRV